MSDKFFLIDKGRLPSPAKCWSCGSVSRDCIDFGVDIGFQGAVLLCVLCVAEAATALPRQQKIDFEKNALRAKVKKAEEILSDLRRSLSDVCDSGIAAIESAGFDYVPEHAGGSSASFGAVQDISEI